MRTYRALISCTSWILIINRRKITCISGSVTPLLFSDSMAVAGRRARSPQCAASLPNRESRHIRWTPRFSNFWKSNAGSNLKSYAHDTFTQKVQVKCTFQCSVLCCCKPISCFGIVRIRKVFIGALWVACLCLFSGAVISLEITIRNIMQSTSTSSFSSLSTCQNFFSCDDYQISEFDWSFYKCYYFLIAKERKKSNI